MHRSTSTTRRACALGTTVALIGLTTGLGVFTSTAAFAVDGDTTTAAVAPADPSQPTGTPTDAPSNQPTDSATTPAPATQTPTDGAAPAPTDTDTAVPAPTDEPTAPATTAPAKSTAPASATASTEAAPSAVAPTVTIVGKPTVGTTLRYDTTGIDDPSKAVWAVAGTEVATGSSFGVLKEFVGKTITLTVTGATPEQTATATTTVVTEDVVAADETTADEPLELELTAGQQLSRSFAVTAGSGDVTYSVGYTDPSEADPTDPEDSPENRLPDGVSLDPSTGLLSGTPTSAYDYEFTVVATNGTSTATEYVVVTVTPAEAVGVLAWATDTSSSEFFDAIDENGDVDLGHPAKSWVILPDGSIISITQPADFSQDPTFVEGGNPTVEQGGSLWISGEPVDEYGNLTVTPDGEGDYPEPVVTSDVASDQIAFDDDEFATKVTFPHASTHRLTVAQDDLSVSFPVTVVPTAVPAGTTPVTPVVAAPVAPTGRLAFTGADETAPIAWALGLIAAGAGLVGARALRRRRAQR